MKLVNGRSFGKRSNYRIEESSGEFAAPEFFSDFALPNTNIIDKYDFGQYD